MAIYRLSPGVVSASPFMLKPGVYPWGYKPARKTGLWIWMPLSSPSLPNTETGTSVIVETPISAAVQLLEALNMPTVQVSTNVV